MSKYSTEMVPRLFAAVLPLALLSTASVNVAFAQDETAGQQLVAQMESTFHLRSKAFVDKNNLVLVLFVPPAETLKTNATTREAFAHRIARFARKHSALGGSVDFISVILTSIRDSSGTRVPTDIGHWYWLTQYLDADSARVPDLLTGSGHVKPSTTSPPKR
jgi:hypothetical protein